MKKLLSLTLTLIMALSCTKAFAEDTSSGVFGTEYLENAKELEFNLDITEESYLELYVYNHSTESLKIEINKGTRNIYKKEIASKQTAAVYAEEKFTNGTYKVKAISSGTENLCGKITYQITNSKDNLQKKIPDNLTDMNGINVSKNEDIVIFKTVEPDVLTPRVTPKRNTNNNEIIVLQPSPEAKAMNELFNYGILKGDPDGNQRPNDTITRAEAAALIIRANANFNEIFGKYSFKPVFNDIENHWAAKEISFAYENTFVEGTSETTFEPDKSVSVVEFAKMLVMLLGYNDKAKQQGEFPDGYVSTATSLGIMDNLSKGTTENALRSDAALMLTNALDVPIMRVSGISFAGSVPTTEYIVMDGKNGTELETLRTIIESK